MTESKQALVNRLNEAIVQIEGLQEIIEKEDMYLPDGIHVDNEFLLAMLGLINRSMSTAVSVMGAIKTLMGITDEDSSSVQKSKSGKKWSVEKVLENCTFNDNILRLPNVQLNPKSYAEVKKWITEAGGTWVGGKTQGFTFDFDATRVVGILMSGQRCNLKKDFQFYSTPPELADWLVSLSSVDSGCTILEPSAGTGAIIAAVQRACPDAKVDAFELMPENRQALEKMQGVTLVGEDFTNGVPRLYDRIFANPPFTKNQDIRHVRMMYDSLDPNSGEMCAITSRHWLVANERECIEFRDWLNEVRAETHEIPSGVFDESGTGVSTMAIVIKKHFQN